MEFFFKNIYLFLVALGLRCCVWAFSRCREPGLLSSCGAQASSHCSGFSCCGTQVHCLQDVESFQTCDGTSIPRIGRRFLTTGPPGKPSHFLKGDINAKNVRLSLLTKQLEILKTSNWFSPNSFKIVLSCLLDKC